MSTKTFGKRIFYVETTKATQLLKKYSNERVFQRGANYFCQVQARTTNFCKHQLFRVSIAPGLSISTSASPAVVLRNFRLNGSLVGLS